MRSSKFRNRFLCEMLITTLLQEQDIDDIAASPNDTGTNDINSTGNNNLTLLWNLVGVNASVDAISRVNLTTSNSFFWHYRFCTH